MTIEKGIKFVFSIFICVLAGMIGSLATAPYVEQWFNTINKPFFSPPQWIFSPVWITLYIMMGIALYLVMVSRKKNKKLPYSVFAFQLLLNIMWSVLFFSFKSIFAALIDMFMLWGVLMLTIVIFYFYEKKAAYVLIPYFLWLTYGFIINIYIWQMNLN